jgi:hypothetical protein
MDLAIGRLRGSHLQINYETVKFSEIFGKTGIMNFRLNLGGKGGYIGAGVETFLPNLFEEKIFRFYLGLRFG